MWLCDEQNGLCCVAVIIFKYVKFNFGFFPACDFYTTHSEMTYLFIFLKPQLIFLTPLFLLPPIKGYHGKVLWKQSFFTERGDND